MHRRGMGATAYRARPKNRQFDFGETSTAENASYYRTKTRGT